VVRDNERLKEMVKTHEQMEEFYLKELDRRKREKSNLEWRLSLLNDEIQNSKRKKPGKQSQVLRERVEAARRGLESTPRVETEPERVEEGE
jgi:septal ring factor EnvC (AmiA/AmiB activator)